MTPIESRYDIRLVTIIALAMEAIETLAIEVNCNPEQLVAEQLFLITKKVHERGEEPYLNLLLNNYQIIDEVLD